MALFFAFLILLAGSVRAWDDEEDRRLSGSYGSYNDNGGSYNDDSGSYGVDFTSQISSKYGSVNMATMTSSERISKVGELATDMVDSANTAGDLTSALSTLTNLALDSTGMDTSTATSVFETLGLAVGRSALTTAVSGLTATQKKIALGSVIASASKVQRATSAKLSASMAAGDPATTITDASGDLKIQISKMTPAAVTGSTQSITSTNGDTISFQMPSTLPAELTSLTDVTLTVASRATPFEDPDGEYSIEQSISVEFVDANGNKIDMDFSADPVEVTIPTSTALVSPGCLYFNETLGDWASNGLTMKSFTSTSVICETEHFTEFGVGNLPTSAPTKAPTQVPTAPTATPTTSPTADPTLGPTPSPTEAPTASPTADPTLGPTPSPTEAPTASPSATPTSNPTPDDGSGGVGTRYPTPTPRGMYSSPGPEPTPSPPAPTAVPTAAPTYLIQYTTKFSSGSMLDQRLACSIAMLDRYQALGIKWSCCNEGSQYGFCDGTHLNGS